MPPSPFTPDLSTLLAALRHGDSFFPSGAMAFSHGLESRHADGRLTTPDAVEAFIIGQVRGRWATCDRGVLVAAHDAGDDLEAVESADQLLDALTLSKELREGSRRAGAALLSVHVGLGTRNARAYDAGTAAGSAPRHLAAIQGLVWRGSGLPRDHACAMSGHSLCVGLLGAALRLGAIGHVMAQRLLATTHQTLAAVLRSDPPPLNELHSYAPAAEIAVMRHETQLGRLFAN